MSTESELFTEEFWKFIYNKYRLGPAKIKIIILCCRGLTIPKVAEKLKRADGTVRLHLRYIYLKFGVENKFQLLLKLLDELIENFYIPVKGQAEKEDLRRRERKLAFDGQFTEEQMEFVAAMERFKKEHHKPYPTWSDALGVLKKLGYKKEST